MDKFHFMCTGCPVFVVLHWFYFHGHSVSLFLSKNSHENVTFTTGEPFIIIKAEGESLEGDFVHYFSTYSVA